MEVIGYIAALIIGITLGLIGGGGSILTVPVMVYLFGIHPLLATSYSLFVVGSTSLVGAINNYRKGWVSMRTVLLFCLSSILTVFLTRKFLVPAIPDEIATIGSFTITEPFLTMVLFAVLMLYAAFTMIKNVSEKKRRKIETKETHHTMLIVYGVLIGFVTGLLGAGGGFLLIPALVLLMHLPMKKAIGTSLTIIALNSLIGFIGDLGHFVIDWRLLITISLVAIVGIFVGGLIGKRLPGEKLKKWFGWFMLFTGIYILLHELV